MFPLHNQPMAIFKPWKVSRKGSEYNINSGKEKSPQLLTTVRVLEG